jgi:hypothetical protein
VTRPKVGIKEPAATGRDPSGHIKDRIVAPPPWPEALAFIFEVEHLSVERARANRGRHPQPPANGDSDAAQQRTVVRRCLASVHEGAARNAAAVAKIAEVRNAAEWLFDDKRLEKYGAGPLLRPVLQHCYELRRLLGFSDDVLPASPFLEFCAALKQGRPWP